MNTLKILAALTILMGSVALVFGTGAFSAVGADRLADVGVSDDDSALLGVGIDDETVQNNQEFTLVTLENRFDDEIDSVEVTVVDDGGFNHVEIVDTPEPLPSGTTGDITAQVVFGPQSSGTIEVRISASGPSNSVDMNREISVQRSAPKLCTIENDDRIGESSFTGDDEFFDCTIRLDSNRPYGVGLEDSTVTGGFELFTNVLQEFEFEGNEIGGPTEIEIRNSVNGDIEFVGTTFHDAVSFTGNGPLNDIGLEESTVEGNFDVEVQNLNGDFEIETATIDGNLKFESHGPVSGDIETEDTSIASDYILTINDNVNSDIEIEETEIGGDLTIVVDGNLNGDITIEDSTIGGDVTIIVEGNVNGDIELDDSMIGGTVTTP